MNPDLEQLQDFAIGAARSDQRLRYAAVTSVRDMAQLYSMGFEETTKSIQSHLQSTVEIGRNGRKGLGIVVERPRWEVDSQNVPGLVGPLLFSFIVFDLEALNNDAAIGANLAPDAACLVLAKMFHLWRIDGFGMSHAERSLIDPHTEMEFAYYRAWRLSLRFPKCTAEQEQRCGIITLTDDGNGSITLTCPTSGAVIWYTTDGTFPGPGSAEPEPPNSNAQEYSGAFLAPQNTIVHFCAWKDGLNPGPVQRYIVP